MLGCPLVATSEWQRMRLVVGKAKSAPVKNQYSTNERGSGRPRGFALPNAVGESLQFKLRRSEAPCGPQPKGAAGPRDRRVCGSCIRSITPRNSCQVGLFHWRNPYELVEVAAVGKSYRIRFPAVANQHHLQLPRLPFRTKASTVVTVMFEGHVETTVHRDDLLRP